MVNFDDIWPQFNWVIEEMQDGMSLFEGYIPTIDQDELLDSLLEMIRRTRVHSLKSSIWSNDATDNEMKREYTPAQYVELFRANRIICLHFIYEMEADSITLEQMLMFEKDDLGIVLEIICYREPILGSDNYREAVSEAISEFRYLKQLFGGEALFIGPDTSSYPKSNTECPEEWLKIE